MTFRFSGKNALILGGSCDLALTLAEAMIAADLYPILTFRSVAGRKKIDARLASLGGKYKAAYLNFGERASLTALLAGLSGGIAFVVDFAHGDFEGYVAADDETKIHQYFNDHVAFRAETLKRIARLMLERKQGRFVFVSSTAAARTRPGQGFYAAAKAASEALYRTLGLELGKKGITTVTLRPGYIRAGRGKAYLEAHGEEALRLQPTGSFITERNVAETILFLLSEGAGGFNATELTMDGGMTAAK